jgi:hypothetical protein
METPSNHKTDPSIIITRGGSLGGDYFDFGT